jgi:FkbM family methyltransferase
MEKPRHEASVNAAALFVYRLYIALKTSVLDRTVLRWPRARSWFSALKDFVRRHLFHSRDVWLQVRSGPMKGLWMHLRIPEEAGFWRGEHEPEVLSAITAMTASGDVVYDIGAHLGSMALTAARHVATFGRVFAFEADPSNVERLRENVTRNAFDATVHIVPAAVWSRSSASGIAFRRSRVGASRGGVEADGQHPVLADGDNIQVPAVTIDDFIAAGNPAPHLIKIDVEGGECEVLRGGRALFATQRPYLIVEIHHQQAFEWFEAWLKQSRYAARWKIPIEDFPRYLIAWPVESVVGKATRGND